MRTIKGQQYVCKRLILAVPPQQAGAVSRVCMGRNVFVIDRKQILKPLQRQSCVQIGGLYNQELEKARHFYSFLRGFDWGMTLCLSFSCFAFAVFGYMTCDVFLTVDV